MNHRCAACGYEGLREAQRGPGGEASFEVCPCCGFESGYDDDVQETSPKAYRKDWIARGSPWFSKARRPPKGWTPPKA